MKKIILVLLVLVSVGCSLGDEILDDVFKSHINKSEIYYHVDFDNMRSYMDIVFYLNEHITYKEDAFYGWDDYWQSPQETFERGYGDCEDFAIAFINIYYVIFGEKCNLVVVWDSREVVAGGIINHAIIELNLGGLIDPRSGKAYPKSSVNYRYAFDLFFY